MEIDVTVSSTDEAIGYINQLCHLTFQHYNIKDYQKECFLIHELVINAIEATKRKYAEASKYRKLRFYLQLEEYLIVKMIDEVGGLSQGYLDALNPDQLQNMLWCESGRGLLLIKDAVEHMWYKKVDGQFELGFKKGVVFND